MVHLQEEFCLDADLIYFNHAAVAPWPRRTRDAVSVFANENSTSGTLRYPHWLEREGILRRRITDLICAPSADQIALVKNTSEGLSIVAYGLDWRAGDVVVTSDQEFPSNRIVWESLQSRYGVITQAVPLGDDPEQSLMDACTAKTRLLTISSVQYGTGLRMDLARLGAFCRERGILFCVDAIQSVGALQMDVQAIHADFAVADGHKWMLGPEGVGFLYLREEHIDQLILRQFGWHMVRHRGDYTQQTWEPAGNATRFECGSPNMMGIHALEASLSLIEEVGMAEVERRVLANTDHLMRALTGLKGVELLTRTAPDRRSGIVTFHIPGRDTASVMQQLSQGGLFCAQRGGGIRLSPHFYNTEQQLDDCLRLIGGCA